MNRFQDLQVEKIIEYSLIKSFTPSQSDRSFEELINQIEQNKDRVPFYMSITTKMKFIVRGKSVDF